MEGKQYDLKFWNWKMPRPIKTKKQILEAKEKIWFDGAQAAEIRKLRKRVKTLKDTLDDISDQVEKVLMEDLKYEYPEEEDQC